MNSEQKRCRKRGDVNARFEVIELFLNRPYMRRPAVAGRRVYREVLCVLPLLPKSHCHLVGAGRGSMVAHHIHEALPAGGAGGISKPVRIGYRRDQSAIAENVDAACNRPGPGETRCIYSPHHFPTGGEHDVFSG